MNRIKKVTQENTAKVWEHVPLQDFTPSSDIDSFCLELMNEIREVHKGFVEESSLFQSNSQ